MAREKDLSKWANLPYPLVQDINPTAAAQLSASVADISAVSGVSPTPMQVPPSQQHTATPAPVDPTTAAAASDPPARSSRDTKWTALLASRAVGTRRSSRGGTKAGASDASLPTLADRAAGEGVETLVEAAAAAVEAVATPGSIVPSVEKSPAPEVAGAALGVAVAVHAHGMVSAVAEAVLSVAVLSHGTAMDVSASPRPWTRVAGQKRVPIKAGNAVWMATPDVCLIEGLSVTTLANADGSLCVPAGGTAACTAGAASDPPARNIRRKRSGHPVHHSVDEDADEWVELDLMQKGKGRKVGRGLKPGTGLDSARMALAQSRAVVAMADVQWETAAGGWEQPVCGMAYVSLG